MHREKVDWKLDALIKKSCVKIRYLMKFLIQEWVSYIVFLRFFQKDPSCGIGLVQKWLQFPWHWIQSFQKKVANRVFHGSTNLSLRGRLHSIQEITISTSCCNPSWEEIFSPVQIPTLSRDMVEQLKLVDRLVDVVDHSNRQNCLGLLRNIVDKVDSSYV